MNTKVVLVALVVLLAGVGVFAYSTGTLTIPGTTACTQEAKVCPDGSTVGRTGPNCEFAACPTVVIPPATSFSASPTSGDAPLTVVFRSTLTEPNRYTINFGNGTSGTYQTCAQSYPYQCSIEHVYPTSGTYVAQLIYSVCPPNTPECLAPSQIAASVTIVVR